MSDSDYHTVFTGPDLEAAAVNVGGEESDQPDMNACKPVQTTVGTSANHSRNQCKPVQTKVETSANQSRNQRKPK